jgi:hypothetical protein
MAISAIRLRLITSFPQWMLLVVAILVIYRPAKC